MHKSEIQDRKIFVSYLILVSFCTLSYLKLIRHQCKNDMDSHTRLQVQRLLFIFYVTPQFDKQ